MKYIIILTLYITSLMATEQKIDIQSFSFFDTNEDGQISREEFSAAKEKLSVDKGSKEEAKSYFFYKIDTDGDGIIKKEEFSRYSILRQSNESIPDNQCL